MSFSTLQGLVRRRILVNFRVDPEVMQRRLPPPFSPQLVHGWAMAGICLIRLEQLRPRGFPTTIGLASENATHRVAVTWTDHAGAMQRGVYIPRRDTGALLNYLVGGRLFPGAHRQSRFRVRDGASGIELAMASDDGSADVQLRAQASERLPSTSAFGSLEAASSFFAAGSTGYSPTRDGARLDGLELRTCAWRVEALDVEAVHASYYADVSRFPPGSVEFDSALIMRDIPHEWRSVPAPSVEDPREAATCLAY